MHNHPICTKTRQTSQNLLDNHQKTAHNQRLVGRTNRTRRPTASTRRQPPPTTTAERLPEMKLSQIPTEMLWRIQMFARPVPHVRLSTRRHIRNIYGFKTAARTNARWYLSVILHPIYWLCKKYTTGKYRKNYWFTRPKGGPAYWEPIPKKP